MRWTPRSYWIEKQSKFCKDTSSIVTSEPALLNILNDIPCVLSMENGSSPTKLRQHEREISVNNRKEKKAIEDIYNGLEIENDSLLNGKTLIDDFGTMNSNGFDHSLISRYERDLEDLELSVEWKEIENRPISELVLKKNTVIR